MSTITIDRAVVEQALEALNRGLFKGELIQLRERAASGLEAALAQQGEPTVTEDMKSAVRWAPSSAYWSQRLREFFGPDAREGIDALERRLAKAQQAEPVEPVAWECKAGGLKPLTQRQYDAQTVATKRHYTRIAPPQRTMVPLTEDEIAEAVREADLDWQAGWTLDEHAPNRFDALARAVEKASWEKNNGQA